MKSHRILIAIKTKILNKSKVRAVFFTLILLFLIPLIFIEGNSKREPGISSYESNTRIFFDEKTFLKGVEFARNQKSFTEKVYGGIIPHHQLPGFIISQFYKGLENQKPKTIILLGPNHYEKGNYFALTSNNYWPTPYGDVLPDKEIIDKLTSHNFVQLDNSNVSNDHSVGTSMPFIKYFLPDTKVVPIILSGKMTQQETEKLASILATLDLPIVASVDFSHNLKSADAQEKDIKTLKILKTFDIKQVFSLNSDYLDSPPSIAVLLSSMQKMKKTNYKVLQNTNSGILTNNYTSPTTSYFSIIYY